MEKYYSVSPFAYCSGNPLINTDPFGLKDDKAIKEGVNIVAGGVFSIVAGGVAVSSLNPYVVYMGAMSISSGITEIGLGSAKIILGLKSNGYNNYSENATKIPNSISTAVGMAFDDLLEFDEKTSQTVFSIIDLGLNVATLQSTTTYSLIDIIKVLNSTENVYNNTKKYVEKELNNSINNE